MGAHDGAVEHRVLVVGSLGQMREDALPDAGSGPAGKAAGGIVPVAKAFWQIAPGDPGAIAVEDGVDEQAVVCGGHANAIRTARQQILDPVPLVIA